MKLKKLLAAVLSAALAASAVAVTSFADETPAETNEPSVAEPADEENEGNNENESTGDEDNNDGSEDNGGGDSDTDNDGNGDEESGGSGDDDNEPTGPDEGWVDDGPEDSSLLWEGQASISDWNSYEISAEVFANIDIAVDDAFKVYYISGENGQLSIKTKAEGWPALEGSGTDETDGYIDVPNKQDGIRYIYPTANEIAIIKESGLVLSGKDITYTKLELIKASGEAPDPEPGPEQGKIKFSENGSGKVVKNDNGNLECNLSTYNTKATGGNYEFDPTDILIATIVPGVEDYSGWNIAFVGFTKDWGGWTGLSGAAGQTVYTTTIGEIMAANNIKSMDDFGGFILQIWNGTEGNELTWTLVCTASPEIPPAPEEPTPDEPAPEKPVTETAPPYQGPAVIPVGVVGGKPSIEGDDSAKGWTAVSEKIADAKDGETISLNLDGKTGVDKTVLTKAAGKDIDLKVAVKGAVWEINGKDIPDKAKSVNLGIKHNSNNIPAKAIKQISKTSNVLEQMTLKHNGKLGFTANLTLNVKAAEGSEVTLLRYDKRDKDFEFIDSATVENGTVTYAVETGGDYIMTITDKAD